MGYGKRAIQQLIQYYSGDIVSLNEDETSADHITNNNNTKVHENILFQYLRFNSLEPK